MREQIEKATLAVLFFEDRVMKKIILASVVASTLLATTTFAAIVECPSVSQVNAGKTTLLSGQYVYKVVANNVAWTSIQPETTPNTIVSMENAMTYPNAVNYVNGDMSCNYATETGSTVTLYTYTLVTPDTTQSNAWRNPESNGVEFCGSMNASECPAVTR